MHRLLSVALIAGSLTSFAANAFVDCGSVKVFKLKSLIEVDGAFFQMKVENLGKKSWRLVGHDMTFVKSKDSNTLITPSGTRHLTCTDNDSRDNGLNKVKISPYSANPITQSASSASNDDSDDSNSGTGNSSGSKGGKGGGKGGGGGGGKGGGNGGGGHGGGGQGGGGGGGKGK